MTPSRVEHPFGVDRLDDASQFRPEWDVESAGRAAFEALGHDVAAVRARPEPDGGRKIHLLLGPVGHGKTHLFGRLLRHEGNAVELVYVPMTSDPALVKPTDHVRYQLVEHFFQSGGGFAPVRRRLAELLAPSFERFFDQLPDNVKERHHDVRRRLAEDGATAALEVISPVAELAPYHRLADSVQRRFPDLPRGPVRALVLGLSPAADDARAWLRGEADGLADGRLRDLQLPETSPDVGAVLTTIAALLQQARTPLLVCLDQLEWVLRKDPEAFRELSTALMSWLVAIPNVLFVLGVLHDDWKKLLDLQSFQSFSQRTAARHVADLEPDQAVELVAKRMLSWIDAPADAAEGWPFDLESLKAMVRATPVGARGLLQLCQARFDDWLARGRQGRIVFGKGPEPAPPLSDAFAAEWRLRVEAVKRTAKAAEHYQEAELWEGVREAVEVAKKGRVLPGGVSIERISPQALKKTATDSRPSAQIDLVIGPHRRSVVLAVSKKDSGAAFNGWLGALEKATEKDVAGAVVVWPKATLGVGKAARSYLSYAAKLRDGSLRAFPLDEHMETFHQLEALRQLVSDAESGALMLGDKMLSAAECRTLLAETKALAHLPLFDALFANWPSVEAARASADRAVSEVRPVAAAAVGGTAVNESEPPARPDRRRPPQDPPSSDPVREPAPAGGPQGRAEEMLQTVVRRLRSKGQDVEAKGVQVGPTFFRLKLGFQGGSDFSMIKKQAENLKLHLGLQQKPLIAAQAGYISVDVQRPDRQAVDLPSVLAAPPDSLRGACAFPVGVDVAGEVHWLDFADPNTCHLLVAGATGSGKSEFLKAMLAGLAARLGPERLQFLLVDPKQVTFNFPGESPYLLRPVVYDAEEAAPLLTDCFEEMEGRYALLRRRGVEQVADLDPSEAPARWIVVVDEFADLMADRGMKKDLDAVLRRLGAKARAAGIHLVLGTQRPEASVVTPLLRSNLPGRVSLAVSSEKDSKIILDQQPDAAYLLGRGDLLLRRGGGLLRLQSPFVPKAEFEAALRVH